MIEPSTPRLDAGVQTPRLDAGPKTPGLDSNPERLMSGFVKDVYAEKAMTRAAERSVPPPQSTVESTFRAFSSPTIREGAPLGRRWVGRRAEEQSVESVVGGGAFNTIYEDSGNTYLQGGVVTGANGGLTIIPDETLILSGDIPPLAKTGQILYIKASCEVTVSDGVMLPGIKLNSATIHSGFTVPSNHSFTATSETGDLHYEIGRWTDNAFLPSGVGSLLVNGCIGSYYISRV